MSDNAQDGRGPVASARRLAASLLGLVRARAELFTVELQEEKLRAIRLLVWLCTAVVFGIVAILVLCAMAALYLWQTFGYVGLGGLALGALLIAGVVLLVLRRQLLHGPRPFAATVNELRKDFECLRPLD